MTRLSRAAAHILKADPAFDHIVKTSPPMELRPEAGSAFESLLSAIVYQQLAGAAARTIHGRLIAVLGGEPVHPETVLVTDPETMRGAGLSRNKLAAIIDLAAKFVDGTVPTDDLHALSDDEIVARLITVRGVGRWTAEMFLMFQLRRPDVWPVDDLGVRNGWGRIHEMPKPPTPKELALLGEVLRPHRSTAAWYCWRAMATVLPTPPVVKPVVAKPKVAKSAVAKPKTATSKVKGTGRPRPSRPKRG